MSRFDEEPDADPHGECAEQIRHLQDLLKWCYSKLHRVEYSSVDDALMLDAIKLELMQE